MGAYLAGCTASFLSTLTIVFAIAVLGYYLGSIHIKGISLGTAGVLLVALLAGILFSFVPSITLGEKTITFFGEGVTSNYSLLSNIGTALFVTAVGLIAGPKFFRSFNRKMLGYIVMGVVIILSATLLCVIFIKVGGVDPNMMAGLLTGALTSTPGLSAANEVATNSEMVTAGYGIAYLFGVIGVVLFVQIMPKLLKVDMDKERKSFNAANDVEVPTLKDGLKKIDAFSFFPFVLAIVLGRLIGAISIPGINFSLGGSGGMLFGGLIIGHYRHIGNIDLRVDKATLNFMRELGLALFLIGAGVPGGVRFIENVHVSYFIYGAILTMVSMIIGYLLGRYVFHFSLFNNLGSITGGMTSTPALGTLIATTGTEDVASAYAATYPIALVMVVLMAKFLIIMG